jgi:hypothetical protein
MNICSRIKKLETKLIGNQEHWAHFSIGYYENPCEMERTQQRLVREYTAKGNPCPTHCVFINEVPGPTKHPQEEKFLHAFTR